MNIKNFNKGLRKFAAASFCILVLNGCGNSENFVFTNTQILPTQPVLQAPVAVNDTVVGLGNATLTQFAANGVLTNDTVNSATITAFDATTPNGATVVLNADGSFTYTPVFGFTGADTFTYTLENATGSSTATVTVNVNNQGFFVNNAATSNGNGSQATPFDNLTDALNAASSGDTIFVFRGDGTTLNQAGAINLPQGVNLVGQANGLVVGQQIEPAGDRPVIQGPITVNGDNTVSGFSITGSTDDAILSGAGTVNNIDIVNNVFNTSAQSHIDLDNVGGTVNITDNTFNNNASGNDFIAIDMNDTTATYNLDRNTLVTDVNNDPSNGCVVFAEGASTLTLGFNDNDVTSIDTNDDFDDGLVVDIDGTSTCTATITGNTFTRCNSDAIDLDTNATGASLTATVSGNTLDTIGDNGIEGDAQPGTVNLTITGNMIDTIDQDGIDLDVESDNGVIIATVSNNQVSNCGQNGLSSSVFNAGGSSTISFQGNTVSMVGADALFAETQNTGVMCLDITGNTLNDDVVFDNSGTNLRVEQLLVGEGGPLNTINMISGSVTQGGATSVANGTCTTP